MNRDGRVRLRLLTLAREYKRASRKLKHDGYGATQLKAQGEAYQHAAWIVKYQS